MLTINDALVAAKRFEEFFAYARVRRMTDLYNQCAGTIRREADAAEALILP